MVSTLPWGGERILLLANALVVPFAAKETVNDYNRIALRFAVVIVKLVCEINDAQVCGGMERACP
jgi:hypothetical protein